MYIRDLILQLQYQYEISYIQRVHKANLLYLPETKHHIMKKFIISLIAAFLCMNSYAGPFFASRMERFVTNVEQNYKTWTEEERSKASHRYSELMNEYKDCYESLSSEDKRIVNRAIGRYNGVLVRSGLETAEKSIKDLTERLPSLLEGFLSVFDTTKNSSNHPE